MEYKQVTFRIPVQVIEQLQSLSKEMNLSKNKLIEIMISDFNGISKSESDSTSNVVNDEIKSKLESLVKEHNKIVKEINEMKKINTKQDQTIFNLSTRINALEM